MIDTLEVGTCLVKMILQYIPNLTKLAENCVNHTNAMNFVTKLQISCDSIIMCLYD